MVDEKCFGVRYGEFINILNGGVQIMSALCILCFTLIPLIKRPERGALRHTTLNLPQVPLAPGCPSQWCIFRGQCPLDRSLSKYQLAVRAHSKPRAL